MIAIPVDFTMSSANPLVKRLRGYANDYSHTDRTVNDDHPLTLPLCLDLENILQAGMKMHYWEATKLLSQTEERLLVQSRELAKRDAKVQTCAGRGRVFLRSVLNNGSLSHFVAFLLKHKNQPEVYDAMMSLVSDEVAAICESIGKIKFKLDLSNSSFLDETWLLPYRKKHELVPCKAVGITLAHSKDWVVVVDVEAGSVAAEDDKIEIGDVIEELQGQLLKCRRKSFTTNIMKKSKGLPISVTVIKGHHLGEFYRPLIPFLKEAGLDVDELQKKRRGLDPVKAESSKPKAQQHHLGYHAILMGSTPVGRRGDACFIAVGIQNVLGEEPTDIPVTVIPTESTVLTINRNSDKVEMRFNYACISSVGRRKDLPTIAGFISANTSCDIADEFICHVFQMNSAEECVKFLQEVALGFKRTQCAV